MAYLHPQANNIANKQRIDSFSYITPIGMDPSFLILVKLSRLLSSRKFWNIFEFNKDNS